MEIILASQSPRRRELLSLITKEYTVEPSTVNERAIHAASPKALVKALAGAKCRDVAQRHPGALVIGCDTVVDCGGEVLGKPKDAADARRMLAALSGAEHAVHTGVCMACGKHEANFTVTSRVRFFPIPPQEIEAYIATQEPYDKAGAYAIQGRAALWLDAIEGDYYNIMGLPVSRVAAALGRFAADTEKT
ncbi:MAG: Maf family protein [Faecalibacterium sp.]|jgi:septum formation protein|nr:Maf family protein [Faecalibacterium sp.]